jgi:hypothetical protein
MALAVRTIEISSTPEAERTDTTVEIPVTAKAKRTTATLTAKIDPKNYSTVEESSIM